MSYDGGATPASVDAIKKMGNWSDFQLGLLGALDKVGTTASSAGWGRLLQFYPAKPLLVMGLGVNALFTLVFGLFAYPLPMYMSKIMMGITQGLQGVWGTCWVLLWAPAESKTAWLGMGAVAAGIGNGIGTSVAGFATADGTGLTYGFAFKVQAAILFLLWIFMVSTPAESLNLDKIIPRRRSTIGDLPSRPVTLTSAGGPTVAGSFTVTNGAGALSSGRGSKELETQADEERNSVELAGIGDLQADADGSGSLQGTVRNTNSMVKLSGAAATSVIRSFPVAGNAQLPAIQRGDRVDGTMSESSYSQFSKLMNNSIYVWTVLGISAIFYVISGIQYLWVRLFMTWETNKNFVVMGFLLVTGLGGFLGVALGPMIIDSCGGVENAHGIKNSLAAIVKMQLLTVAGACVVFFGLMWRLQSAADHFTSMYICWFGCFVMFASCNGSLAGLTGVNAGALPVQLRSFASGCTIGFQNMLGFALGPLVPGIVMDIVYPHLPSETMDNVVARVLSDASSMITILGDADNASAPDDSGGSAEAIVREDARLLVSGMLAVLVGAAFAFFAAFNAAAAARRSSDLLEDDADNDVANDENHS